MVKKNTNITLDHEKIEKAKKRGINISELAGKALDNALQIAEKVMDLDHPKMKNAIEKVQENPQFAYGQVKILHKYGFRISQEELIKLAEGVKDERSNQFERNEEGNQEGNTDGTGTERRKPETERTIIK